MKTMTCRELGGTCDKPLSASSWTDIVKVMTKHVMENHPRCRETNGTDAQRRSQ
jgi:predicted small metal-binding protein